MVDAAVNMVARRYDGSGGRRDMLRGALAIEYRFSGYQKSVLSRL